MSVNLKALEERLEAEVQRWENSAIRVGELLNQIKESGAFGEAGYRYFQPYYRDRWEERIGRTWETAKKYMVAARVTQEMASEGGGDHTHPVTDSVAARKLGTIPDPVERVRVWNEHVESGEKRAGYDNLDRRIKEAKGEPTVREVLTPEDMADLPSADLGREEKFYFRVRQELASVKRIDADALVNVAEKPEEVDDLGNTLQRISEEYARLADAAFAHRRQGLRAVQ